MNFIDRTHARVAEPDAASNGHVAHVRNTTGSRLIRIECCKRSAA